MALFSRASVVILLSVSAIEARTPVAADSVLRVDDDAPPGGDGLSWATAFRCLQDALAAAAGGPASIRIAQGLQRPDQAEGGQVLPGDRSASFVLGAGIELLGGYAGVGAPDPDARDVDLFVSRLDGDLLGNDGPGFAGNAENSLHVVTVASAGGSTRLDGLRITGGHAEPAAGDVGGAGVLVVAGSGPTVVSHCTLTGNFSSGDGAGLGTDGVALTLDHSSFEDNHAAMAGGGLFSRNADVTLTACSFTGNQADSLGVSQGGGGAAVNAGSLTASDCNWSNNASYAGGALYMLGGTASLQGGAFVANTAMVDGGAVMAYQSAGLELHDLEFSGNQAGGGGGAELRLALDADLLVSGCRFSGNLADSAGGLGAPTGASATILDSVFEGNTADITAGGLATGTFDKTLISGCRIVGNTASESGGGFMDVSHELVMVNCLIAQNHSGDDGGGMQLWSLDTAQLVHCTVFGNVADDIGGGVAIINSLAASLENCIAWGNVAVHGSQLAQQSGLPNAFYVSHSDVQGGAAAVWKQFVPAQQLFWAEGNLNVYPRFADGGDWHLLHSSPCRDVADPSVELAPDVDWEGDPRPTGDGTDMGADEFADRLYVTGTFQPGGGVKAKVLGTPGAVLQAVFVGFGLLDPPLHVHLGDWYLESPVLQIALFVPLSADGLAMLPGTLPTSVPAPYTFYLQALVDGQLSNVAPVAVE